MNNNLKFYINGEWQSPLIPRTLDVINPATEETYTQISLASKADIDKAVAAAKAAFVFFSKTTLAERVTFLEKILEAYNARFEDIAKAISDEMGAPLSQALNGQAWAGRAHIKATIHALKHYSFSEKRGATKIVKEPIGVCALITPWNWPMNQIVCKVAPAIAAGCTMILKPSEIAPISGIIFAEAIHAAGIPKGVFNLINGTGSDAGALMASHPDVDMVSFTGSIRAGVLVAKAGADTVKRVTQELGGKSANIILADADFKTAVAEGVKQCFSNTGQSCDAPSRMLVPQDRLEETCKIAQMTTEAFKTGDPKAADTDLGPVVSQRQYDTIQRLIQTGIDEGAKLITGGMGRPPHLKQGYYVRPTIFANVTPEMTIAREEIFGPVLSIMVYENEDEAIHIANNTIYGLAAYIQSSNLTHARAVAAEMRAGTVSINYPEWDLSSSFGGYKQSGNGREYADFGIHEFLEIKSIVGYGE